jgi:hypothetical protein
MRAIGWNKCFLFACELLGGSGYGVYFSNPWFWIFKTMQDGLRDVWRGIAKPILIVVVSLELSVAVPFRYKLTINNCCHFACILLAIILVTSSLVGRHSCLVASLQALFLSPRLSLVVVLVQLCLVGRCSCCLASCWPKFLSRRIIHFQWFLSCHVLLFWWIVSSKMMNARCLSSTFWCNMHVY